MSDKKQTMFICPKCKDVAFPVVKECDGLIVLCQCRDCGCYEAPEGLTWVEDDDIPITKRNASS